jgi:hypothetical protein
MTKTRLSILLAMILVVTPLICCGMGQSFALEPMAERSGQAILLTNNCDHNNLPAKCICSSGAVIKSKIRSYKSLPQSRFDTGQIGVVNYTFTPSHHSISSTDINFFVPENPATVPIYIQNKSLLI